MDESDEVGAIAKFYLRIVFRKLADNTRYCILLFC